MLIIICRSRHQHPFIRTESLKRGGQWRLAASVVVRSLVAAKGPFTPHHADVGRLSITPNTADGTQHTASNWRSQALIGQYIWLAVEALIFIYLGYVLLYPEEF